MRLIIEPYPEGGLAEIYFAVGDRYFPGEHWTDFIRVLSVWQSALSNDGSDGPLPFMDGPYRFGVQRMDRDTYLFTFYDGSDDAVGPVRHVATKAEYQALRQTLTRWTTAV